METSSNYSIHKSTRLCLSQNNRFHAYTPDFFDSHGILHRILSLCNAHVQPRYFFQHVSELPFHYFFTPAETRSSLSLLSSNLVPTWSMCIFQKSSDIRSPWRPICYIDSNCARTIPDCTRKWIRKVISICARSTQGGRKCSIKILGENPSEARQMEWLCLESKAVIKQYLGN